MATEAVQERAYSAWSSYYHDPIRYVREIMRVEKIYPHQADILEAIAQYDRVAVKAGNGMGKDAVTAWLIEWFLATRPNAQVPCVSATFRQIKNILWKEVAIWTGQSAARSGFELLDARLSMRRFENTWFAEGFSPDDEKKAEGYHAKQLLYIITEAKAVEPGIWNAVRKACTYEGNKIFAQSVPGPQTGDFYEFFTTRRSSWKTFSFQAAKKVIENGREIYRPTCDLISQASIDEKLSYGEEGPLFQAGALANFISQTEEFVIPLSWVEAAQMREVDAEGGGVLAGVDVGGAQAETVIASRRGRNVLPLIAFREAHEGRRSGRIGAELRDMVATAIFVDHLGIGDSLTSRLEELGLHATGINVGLPAHDPTRFADLASELWWTLRERLDPSRAAPWALSSDPKLTAQLVSRKYNYTPKGQIKIEPKKDYMKRTGAGSPDRADAVLLTLAGEAVGPKAAGGTLQMAQRPSLYYHAEQRSAWR